MRKLRMQVIEDIELEGLEYECSVVGELRSPHAGTGLLVDISPPIRFPARARNLSEYLKDLRSLFPSGAVTRAILFPRHDGVSIAPKLSENPANAYVLLPKGRSDWGWGDFHIAHWAVILEEGPRNADWGLTWQ